MSIQLRTPDGVRVASGDARRVPHLLAALVLTGKVLLLMVVVRFAADPAWAHLDGKAPLARAVMYPLGVVAVPVFWATFRRDSAFPWLVDVLVTLTCATDLVGNRLDLYNSVVWFDDAMHVLNAALVSAGLVLLTVPRSSSFPEIAHAAVSIGLSASLVWELFEYATFLTRSTEWTSAYSDTIGDLALGWLGSVLAALVVGIVWRCRDLDLELFDTHPPPPGATRRAAASPGRTVIPISSGPTALHRPARP
jgi:hypothetical protein